ncbi:MFS transporter [Paenibacillus xerothermodurans]|uniref:MFS transporter n=2 Tax=Paenibacillus xerothermodurans TaxID=1977292 RepID=A0A2W1P0P8_PAEXE|nr:MFS transporter [Paenibacillus xerothermodurans]
MLVVTTLAILLTSIDRQLLPTVLPAIMKDFNLTEVQAGWLNSLNFIGTFVGAMLFGVLADVFGKGYRRSWTWVAAIGVAVAAGIGTFFSRTLGSLQIWRVIMGVGTGGSEPVNVAIIGEWWQKENRGFAVGVHHTGFPFGQFLGPVLMGAIIAVATWREAFVWIPLLGVPIMLAQVMIGTKRNQEKVYGWIRENNMTVPIEEDDSNKLENPFKLMKIALSNRNVASSVAMIFLFLWAEAGVATFMTLHLTERVGLSLAEAAVISGASGLTGWIGQAFWGTLSDHLGRKFSLRIIGLGWTVSVLACIFIDSAVSGWFILIIWGLFRNSPFPVTYALLIDSTPKAAASSMGLMIGIALGLSGFLVAPVAGYFIQTWGWTANYMMLAFACVLAFIPMAMLKETVVRQDN